MTICATSCEHELWFGSLFHEGRGFAFPCDAQGHVDLDGLSRQALNNYLYARSVIGRELGTPVIRQRPARS